MVSPLFGAGRLDRARSRSSHRTLVLWFIIRPIFDWLGKVTGSYDGKGPTQSYICAVLVLVLVSAWVMEEIGISSIFGGECQGLSARRELG